MSFWPVPDIMKNDLYQLTPRLFTNRGIRFIILDVDNTIAPYTCQEASPRLKAWVGEMKRAGLELFILSNNRGERPALFAEALGVGYVKKAHKPSTKKARQVLADRGYTPAETALIGDQIYTDVLCAKRLGALAVLVHPIAFSHFLLKLRYGLELPFRHERKAKT
ncbi:MAG: YqeG family HAD IIIA-type phosphatase [Oscillospiraceae bacterium]